MCDAFKLKWVCLFCTKKNKSKTHKLPARLLLESKSSDFSWLKFLVIKVLEWKLSFYIKHLKESKGQREDRERGCEREREWFSVHTAFLRESEKMRCKEFLLSEQSYFLHLQIIWSIFKGFLDKVVLPSQETITTSYFIINRLNQFILDAFLNFVCDFADSGALYEFCTFLYLDEIFLVPEIFRGRIQILCWIFRPLIFITLLNFSSRRKKSTLFNKRLSYLFLFLLLFRKLLLV